MALEAPPTPEPARGEPARVLLVVAAPDYHAALTPFLNRRRSQGYRVVLIDSQNVLGTTQGSEAVSRLVDEIARHTPSTDAPSESRENETGPAAFVLLVGDAPGLDKPLNSARLIPAAIRTDKSHLSRPRSFVTDNVFGLPDDRGQPRLAVGRWPVRTSAEVGVQVRKSLNYERAQVPGRHRGEITFLATTPNYDPALDPLLERMAMGIINVQVKPHWGLRALYSSPRSEFFPGPEETQRQVVRWLEDCTPMTLFAGHGFDCGVDCVRYDRKEYVVLDTEVAAQINGTRPGTVLWMSTCCCGDYDLAPPRRGLAESLMMNPRGPTAIVAGSDETSPYANLLLCLGLAQDVIERSPDTLGEALLRFKRAAFRPGPPLFKNLLLSMEPVERPEFLPEDHQFLYNLLGDPTLELRVPRKPKLVADVVEEPAVVTGQRSFLISGKLDDWADGVGWVSLAFDRMAARERGPDVTAIEDETERRAAYFERFVRANNRIAAREQVQVRDGRFEWRVSVSEPLAAKVRWLQIYTHTEPTSSGDWQDGVAAQPVRLVTDSEGK